jgi:hypothetical protein
MSWTNRANRLSATVSRGVGNDVSIGAVSSRAVLIAPKDEILDGMVVSTGYELRYPRAIFGAVLEGAAVVVDGANYVASEDAMPTGDGSMWIVPLKPGAPPAPVAVTIIYDGDFL